MAEVIEVVYTKGVLKPLTQVKFKENQRLKVRVIVNQDWQRRFDAVLEEIRARMRKCRPEEIERDIKAAIREVRRERRGALRK